MIRFRVGAALVCIVLVFSVVLIPLANADWIMFRSDLSHDGVGTGNPALTPTLLWKYTVPKIENTLYPGFFFWPAFESSPAVVNGVVYIGSNDSFVYALDAANGTKLWSTATADDVFSSPAVVNGVVYIGSDDGNVYALNAANGNKLWNYTTSGAVGGIGSSPAVVNGVVYINSDDGNVYALNAANGNKLWNYTTSALTSPLGYNPAVMASPQFESSPAVVKGVVYVGSGDNIYALNATNGDELWSYTTGAEVESSPAVVKGVVYVGSDDGSVYALGALTSSPSPSPTPTASPSPTVPEFPAQLLGITLVVSMIIVLSTVILTKKRTTAKAAQLGF
ncbi:MAG: PQQ-binding-like beta-propeller repeat protein [Candidatus Bathyarchaeia archaeon]|jgi:outer membrane protein assembly factor BamB